MSKPKSNNRHSKADCLQTPSVAVKDFFVGSRVRVSSTHHLFANQECTISAIPSSDAAIVELASGARERILLKYLEQNLNRERVSVQEQDLANAQSELDPIVEPNLRFQFPAKSSQAIEIGIIEELTPDEERERHRLELKVQRAFYEAGVALKSLRERKLYRSTHRNFEEYCGDRFGFSRRHPYRLIDAASVVDNLCPNGTQETLGTKKIQILPTSERQVRDLVSLEPEQQREIWHKAVEIADGKVPSGRIVKGIVEQMKEKPLYLASDFCSVADVFTLTKLEGEERKYNNYPCVAVGLKDFTVDVEVYDTTLTVKPENLKKIDSPDVRRQLPTILARIKQVRSVGQLDRGANSVLKHLGQQTYLTEVEDGLLQWLESYYQPKE